jgi:hypothetical protein
MPFFQNSSENECNKKVFFNPVFWSNVGNVYHEDNSTPPGFAAFINTTVSAVQGLAYCQYQCLLFYNCHYVAVPSNNSCILGNFNFYSSIDYAYTSSAKIYILEG